MPNKSQLINHANFLSKGGLDLWREAWTHLRALSGDIWDGLKFFMTINGALLAAIVAIYQSKPTSIAIPVLAMVGLAVTLRARSIFKIQRLYYVQMLAKTLLVEKELGFRDHRVGTLDLTFPWGTYKAPIEMLENQSEAWIKEELKRKSSVRWQLLLTYNLLLWVHAIILLTAIVGIYFCLTHFGNCT